MTKAGRRWLYGACVGVGLMTGYQTLEPVMDAVAARNLQMGGVANGPWTTRLDLARPETSSVVRAMVARIGLGANQAEEAIYWNTYQDSDGNMLRGDRTYKVKLPPHVPVEGFWSLTVYGADHYLIPNAHNRYAITDRQLPADGTSSTLWIGPQAPAGVSADSPFWIPSTGRADDMMLVLRAYHPQATMLEDAETVPLPRILEAP